MLRPSTFQELPQHIADPLRATHHLVGSYLQGLSFIIHDTGRDPNYFTYHLLSYLAQDFLQSAVAVATLAMEGLISVAKRELRFVIESSIKLCYVQQKNYESPIAAKLTEFDKELSSQRISIKNSLDLHMLTAPLAAEFSEEVGRLYGQTCDYVHLNPAQILERIAAVDAGRTAGKETASDIEALNALAERIFAASLVLIYHSVPNYVAGDWFVEGAGSTVSWHFTASRYLAAIDTHFDYKAERQDRLAEIVQARLSRITF